MRGFVDGKNLHQGASPAMQPGIVVERVSDPIVNAVVTVPRSRRARIVDFGYATDPSTGAAGADIGPFTIGIRGTTSKFASVTIPTGTPAGSVRSLLNGGLSWAATALTESDRELAPGQPVVFNYGGGSSESVKVTFWVELEYLGPPQPVAKPT